jgi:hypothetical protein
LRALQSGWLPAHEGETALPQEHWEAQTELDLHAAISRGLWFWRDDVLRQWPKKPDWSFWADVPTAKNWEAVALSLDIESRALNVLRGATRQYLRPIPYGLEDEFARRLDLLQRNLGATLTIVNWRERARGADPDTSIKKFVAWALSLSVRGISHPSWRNWPAAETRLNGQSIAIGR